MTRKLKKVSVEILELGLTASDGLVTLHVSTGYMGVGYSPLYILSLSTVVLNSRDRYEKLWLSEFSHF